MGEHLRLGRRWRRFKRENKLFVFLVVTVLIVLCLVALLTYMLTSPNYRVRW